MKRLTDYTDDELLQLTDEQAQQLTTLECAFEGVPLLGLAPVPPPTPAGKPTVEVYTLPSLIFASMDQCTKVRLLLEECQLLETYYVAGYRHQGVQPKDEVPPAQRELYWDPDVYTQHKAELEAHAGRKEEYEKAQREHHRNVEAWRTINTRVYSAISRAKEEQRERQQLLATFKEYVRLADGDNVMALQFLLKAHSNYDEEYVREVVDMPLCVQAKVTEDTPEQPAQPTGADDGFPF